MKIDATPLSGMPFCRPAESGSVIVFAFRDNRDKEHSFACHPDALQEIVAKLTAAGDAAARERGELLDKPGARGVRALIPEKIGVSHDELGPVDNKGIPLGLDL